jgi:hypothetical protein
LGTGGGTLAIAAATLVGSSPDNLTKLLKGMLLVASLFLMVAVVATQIAVYPRTKGMNSKITKDELNKQMLAKNTTTFYEDKYNRRLDRSVRMAVTILSWLITLLV